MIRRLDPGLDADACDAIVRGLSAWFGDAGGVADCARAVRTQDGLVAVEDGEVVGFMTHEPRPGLDHEITWMAVRADRREGGIGTALVAALIDRLPAGTRSLLVKTVSDRDGDPGPEYSQTRGFYLARGFTPVAELDIWGPENPCQVLARPVAP
ncbi:MAG TPA: GNAT family N-acetyltransferase [Actinomycetota bacterium]|nr:GNAT family N-acetyltransferase [Actinomycetota bacterium]